MLKWKKIEVEYAEFTEYFQNSINKGAFFQSFLNVIDIPKYEELTVFQNKDTNEEVVLGVDKNTSQRKIIILNIKSTLQNVEASLKSLCEYLWERDNCNELRLSLVHYKMGESLAVDAELEKRVKAVGFRWVSVNQSNERRMTIYSIKRPLNTIAYKTARRKQNYPVVVEHLTVLSLAESNEKKNHNKCLNSVLALIEMLK